MGQKTNPISLRLQNVNRNFDSCWYSDYFYAKCFSRDLYLNNYINTFFKLYRLPQARVCVNFGIQNIKVYPFFCIPKASRVSLAKNLGLFQHLSKAWNSSPKYFVSSKSKQLSQLKINDASLPVNNLNNNLFFNSSKHNEIRNKQNFFHNLELNKLNLSFKNSAYSDVKNYSFLENISAKLLLNFKEKSVINEVYYTTTNLGQIGNNISTNSIYSKQDMSDNSSKSLLKMLLREYYKSSDNKSSILYENKSPKSLENIFGKINEVSNINKKNLYLLNSETDNIPNLYKRKSKPTKFLRNEHNKVIEDKKTSLYFMPDSNQIKNDIYQGKISKISSISNNSKDSLTDYNLHLYQAYLHNILGNSKSLVSRNQFKYKNYIENFLSSQYNIDLQLFPFISKQNWQSAGFIADEIVYFIERRVSFSRIKNRILRQASMQSYVRGIRITCSGRVGGKSKKAQRATQECVKYGETSLHVFECKIDFASRIANTSFGLVGIKVWICFK